MKQTFFRRTLSKIAIALFLITIITGCLEKDLYDENWKKSQLPPEDSYFNFNMRGDIPLTVDYNAPGFQAYIEVYDQNPIEEGTQKKIEGLEPIYKAYTDVNGKLTANMYIPTTVNEAYLYTNLWGLPLCVKLNATANGLEYDASKDVTPTSRAATTRSVPNFTGASAPFDFNYPGIGGTAMKSLCKWDANGAVGDAVNPFKYITITSKVGEEYVGDIAKRATEHFAATADKTAFLSDANVTNINITENNTELDVIFLTDQAAYQNTLGYYYYKVGEEPNGREAMLKMKKYIIYPNTSREYWILSTGSTARLKFFGEKHDQAGSDNFPAGYVVGWFFISNGFTEYSTIKNIQDIGSYYDNLLYYPMLFSNDKGENRRFVSLDDKKSGLVLLGFEDQVTLNPSAEDYCDVLFYIKSSKAINNNERPVIPDNNEPKEQVETISGILSYEDIWPTGGDYDLNDVVIKYQRTITFAADANGKNYATQIEETFTPIHDGATYQNVFAYQVSKLGNITLPDDCLVETETGSIIINRNVKQIKKVPFTIVRKFNAGEVTKDILKEDFNPYIIVHGYSKADRVEVHLPKHSCTSLADKDMQYTKDDAYYIDKGGAYPFAIDIPYLDYVVPTIESKRIDDSSVYPEFKTWTESHGSKNADWYKHYKGK